MIFDNQLELHEDIFGLAILDYLNGEYDGEISTLSSIAGEDQMSVPYLFRDFNAMPDIEQTALRMCSGKILDLGCGAGSHSLYLQQNHFNVTAIDVSAGAIKACKLRGIKNAACQDIWTVNEKFDTIISMMNGAGFCGHLNNLPKALQHLKSLLNAGGQILIDSSDLVYMYEDENDALALDYYYGEVVFRMAYQNHISPSFNWLYVDFNNLKSAANQVGLNCKKILDGPHFDYLAQLTLQ